MTHAADPVAAQDKIRIEQVRLMLSNTSRSIFAAPLLTVLLFFGLSNDANWQALAVWCIVVIVFRLPATIHARRWPSAAMSIAIARRAVRERIALNALQGIAWGCLPWVAMDTATEAGRLIIMASMASMLAGTMALNASVQVTAIAYGVPMLIVVAAKLWSLKDPAYQILGLTSVVYVASLVIQSRSLSRAAREGIELRFENLDLVEQLRIESQKAKAARLDAEQANAAKTKFLAAASHDLRQPMHAQGLLLEVLAKMELTAGQQDVLANVQETSKAAAEMLDTLLDFSRIEAGVVRPVTRSFSLQPLLHQIERELAPQADAKGLVYRSRETQLAVHSDPALVKLILRNIVANAIRYTERGGVLVGCRIRKDELRVEVWDTGIGIAQQDQQAVFREFHQLGNPERDRRKGLGLGLANCQGLARTLNHTLSLDSTLGRGSVFRLSLPLARTHSDLDLLPGDFNPVAQRDAQLLLHAKVLVIDDDELVCHGMAQLVRGWGCDCQIAGSLEQALRLVEHEPPDLVISDYRLREQRTGVQAIAALRARLEVALPALLITGDTDPERLRDAQSCGVPLLHKPVAPDLLYREVRAALANR